MLIGKKKFITIRRKEANDGLMKKVQNKVFKFHSNKIDAVASFIGLPKLD